MANILIDEKRAVKIGEVCAINLKNIHSMNLTLVNPYENSDIVNFYPVWKDGGISSDDEITFVKYIGNGMFMDLVSDQLLITEAFDADDFGTDVLHAMDKESINEMEKIANFWQSIYNPKNKSEFQDSFSIFIQNPLVIDIVPAPFMSINAENTKKFASQSLEQLRSKMTSAKAMAQQNLKQQYYQYEGKIFEHFSATEKESTSKTM